MVPSWNPEVNRRRLEIARAEERGFHQGEAEAAPANLQYRLTIQAREVAELRTVLDAARRYRDSVMGHATETDQLEAWARFDDALNAVEKVVDGEH